MNKRIPVLTVMGVVVLVTALWQIYHVGDIISDMVLLKKSKIMSDKLGKIEEEANEITKMIKQKLNK